MLREVPCMPSGSPSSGCGSRTILQRGIVIHAVGSKSWPNSNRAGIPLLGIRRVLATGLSGSCTARVFTETGPVGSSSQVDVGVAKDLLVLGSVRVLDQVASTENKDDHQRQWHQQPYQPVDERLSRFPRFPFRSRVCKHWSELSASP